MDGLPEARRSRSRRTSTDCHRNQSTPDCGVGESATPFLGLHHFTLDPYLIILSVKQGGIKYHFLSLWYDSTWNWTPVSRATGEHSTHYLPKIRCPWCNGYRRRIWTRWHEFKSWTWLIAFHIALIPLGKVWIQLFSLQLWVNSRAD